MNAIETVAKQFALSTRLFKNVLEGITDEESLVRLNNTMNHLRWIAGHLLTIRYSNIVRMKVEADPFPHAEKYAIENMPPPNSRRLDENIEYPTLQELLQFWDKYAALLNKVLQQLNEEALSTTLPFRLPIDDNTVLGAFAFMVFHESYHIGQMSLIRTALKHTSMKFV